ncbi:MAG: hypothetical protein Q9224_001683 [Gallowayella concinna]
MSFTKSALIVLLAPSLLFTLISATPTNATLVRRKDYEPGDTLNRTMCICTNNNNFVQNGDDAYSLGEVPPDHQVAIVYNFNYYNHRLDHHFSLTVQDNCPTEGTHWPGHLSSRCLKHLAKPQYKTYCGTYYVGDLPGRIKIHTWKFCYGFRGDTFHNPKMRDFFQFYKDTRKLPRKRDWIATVEEVGQVCGGVCNMSLSMEDGVFTNDVLVDGVQDGDEYLPLGERPVVLKFGGTSVGKFAPDIAKICLSAWEKSKIAVVCSARSGVSKAGGTTNRLLKAVEAAASTKSLKESAGYSFIISTLEAEHIDAARCITSPEISQRCQASVATEFEDLKRTLDAVPKTGTVDPHTEDRVVSVGEKLSSLLLAALLEDTGIPSQYIDLSDIIQFPVPDYLSQKFYQDLSSAFGQHLSQYRDKVPVITGFFGRIPGGLVQSLGRGYSDLCAALVAVGLQATELQVWKEVDGVFTADPRKVPTARLLPTLTPHEAGELTFYGSEVIHNFTLQQCVPRIPIRIKNVLRPYSAGTIIQPDPLKSIDQYKALRPKRPSAVTVKQKITVVNVHSNRKVDSPEFLARICTILAGNSLAVDLFEKNECHVSLAVHSKDTTVRTTHGGEERFQTHADFLKKAVSELEEYGVVDVVHGMAILSLIGTGLKRSIGIAGRLFTALGDNNINIEMISQGASEISIACVIEEREAHRALNVVHSELFTYLD